MSLSVILLQTFASMMEVSQTVRTPKAVAVNTYLFKVTYRNFKQRCETCSKLTTKVPERFQ